MRQVVEEINVGRLTVDKSMARFKVLTRHTVRKWLDRVRVRTFSVKQTSQQPPRTLVEQMAHKADELAGRVKQLEKKLDHS